MHGSKQREVRFRAKTYRRRHQKDRLRRHDAALLLINTTMTGEVIDMATREVLIERRKYYSQLYEKLQGAILKLLDGGVKSYTIDNRQLTRYDVPQLEDELERIEEKIDELDALIEGRRPRAAFGVVIRDW